MCSVETSFPKPILSIGFKVSEKRFQGTFCNILGLDWLSLMESFFFFCPWKRKKLFGSVPRTLFWCYMLFRAKSHNKVAMLGQKHRCAGLVPRVPHTLLGGTLGWGTLMGLPAGGTTGWIRLGCPRGWCILCPRSGTWRPPEGGTRVYPL